MISQLTSWWTKDTPRNTFIYTNFIVGLPFSLFNTYNVYQLQVTGFLIGSDLDGLPCSTYCIVPFGNQRLDLNTVLLYMNALTFGLGGAISIVIIAYADFWRHKTYLVIIFIVLYGALAIPSYWLTDPTLATFNALFSLYVVFNIVTLILIAILSIYVPHCMRIASSDEPVMDGGSLRLESTDGPKAKDITTAKGKARKYGFAMSIFGMLSSNIASVLILAIVAILSGALTDPIKKQSAGLLVSTIIGCFTVVAAIPPVFGLPQLPAKPWPTNWGWSTGLVELFVPFQRLLRERNMLLLLLGYTVYTDTSFALGSILGQLYYTELQPDTLEFSLYTLANSLFFVVFTTAFYISQNKWKYSMEKCFVLGYAIILIVPIWGCIGIAKQESFGNKNRWEFYVQLLITNASSSIVNPTFRILYSELIPPGEEVMWFGMQVVLNSATTWVSYVATGPLQNRTHDLRFPLILCLAFFAVAVGLEGTRLRLRKGKERVDSGSSTHEEEKEARTGSSAEAKQVKTKVTDVGHSVP